MKEVEGGSVAEFMLDLLKVNQVELLEVTEEYVADPQELIENLKHDSEGETVTALISVPGKVYEVIFEQDDIREVRNGSLMDFMADVVNSKEAELIREEEEMGTKA